MNVLARLVTSLLAKLPQAQVLAVLRAALLGWLDGRILDAIDALVAQAQGLELLGPDKAAWVHTELRVWLPDLAARAAGYLINLAIEIAVARLKAAGGGAA